MINLPYALRIRLFCERSCCNLFYTRLTSAAYMASSPIITKSHSFHKFRSYQRGELSIPCDQIIRQMCVPRPRKYVHWTCFDFRLIPSVSCYHCRSPGLGANPTPRSLEWTRCRWSQYVAWILMYSKYRHTRKDPRQCVRIIVLRLWQYSD